MRKSNNKIEYKDIKCYCGADRTKKTNYVFTLGSREYDEWLNIYINDLIEYETDATNVKVHYHDPDKSYKYPNKEFFIDLTTFLNKQEFYYIKEENRYTYRFEEADYDKGICVIKNDKTLFYLRSDQFGFSAPTPNKRKYPYDLYYNTDDNDKCKQIAKWISYTRTIGGSFLWPYKKGKKGFHGEYNGARGGKIDSRNNYYMQDRVDLALYEISCFYKGYKKTKLSTYTNKYNYAKEWFEHFESFSKYIKYFCFEDFVVGNEVKDMTKCDNTTITIDSYLNIIKNPFFKKPQEKTTIFNILDTLSKNILNRSFKISNG